ncbi:hypothetical protein D3C81_479390 [compost metagenome]
MTRVRPEDGFETANLRGADFWVAHKATFVTHPHLTIGLGNELLVKETLGILTETFVTLYPGDFTAVDQIIQARAAQVEQGVTTGIEQDIGGNLLQFPLDLIVVGIVVVPNGQQLCMQFVVLFRRRLSVACQDFILLAVRVKQAGLPDQICLVDVRRDNPQVSGGVDVVTDDVTQALQLELVDVTLTNQFVRLRVIPVARNSGTDHLSHYRVHLREILPQGGVIDIAITFCLTASWSDHS